MNFQTIDVVSDTGTMGIGGAVNYSGSVFTQTVGGAGMTGTSDAVRFTYVILNGNGTFTATNGGATSVDPAAFSSSAYTYLRIVRSGNTFSGYTSTAVASGSWLKIGSTITISMAGTVYVGLWCSARDNGYLPKATFDNVAVTPTGLAAPALSSFAVNDGSAQRSMVRTLSLNFNQPVSLTTAALTLQQQQSNGISINDFNAFASKFGLTI